MLRKKSNNTKKNEKRKRNLSLRKGTRGRNRLRPATKKVKRESTRARHQWRGAISGTTIPQEKDEASKNCAILFGMGKEFGNEGKDGASGNVAKKSKKRT